MKKLLAGFIVLSILKTAAFSQDLQFGNKGSINDLINTVYNETGFSGCSKEIVSFSINKGQLDLYKIEQYDIFTLEGALTSGKEGEPVTYILSQQIKLDLDQEICGIKVIGGEFIEIKNNIFLAPRPKPLKWDGISKIKKRTPDPVIYGTNAVFPGKLNNFTSGSDGKNTIVNVQFYPIQYNPVEQKAYLILNAQVEVYYRKNDSKRFHFNGNTKTDALNIILTTEIFADAADTIQKIHEINEGVSTEIVNIEWINANYTEAEDPGYEGYANIPSNPVTNYEYALAKKIVTYLRDNAAHPNLQSITILGDANIVPPSYYFYINNSGMNGFEDWICSDLLYASPDYDFILNYQFGRIPATTVAEADLFAEKMKNWKYNFDESWFNNVSLIGGEPFGTDFLIGEVMTLDPLNRGYIKDKNITKLYLTNETETHSDVIEKLSDGNTGILFHIDHGSGDAMYLGEQYISYTDVMGLSGTDKYPVVISIACDNGGYDTELISAWFTNCFAEGVLFSEAGGICYFGGVRSNAGVPDLYFKENGELLVGDEPYMAKMLTDILKYYSLGFNTLGEINNNVISEYYAYLNPDNYLDWTTLFAYSFLGDPVLSVSPQGSLNYTAPLFNVNPQAFEPGGGITAPVYYISDNYNIPLDFSANTNTPSINQKIFTVDMTNPEVTEIIESNTLNESPFEYTYTPDISSKYMISYETSDFKETRLYFQVTDVDNIPPLSFNLLDIENEDSYNYDLTWNSSFDYDGTIDFYTIMEFYNPSFVVDSCNSLDFWTNNNFSIYSGGYNSAYSFNSGTGNNYSSSIKSFLPYEVSEGDNLEFYTKYIIEEDFDYAFIDVIDEDQNIINLDIYTGLIGSWHKKTYSLADFVGQNVHFQIRYVTDGSINYSGLYLDNISPAVQFENINTISNIYDTTFNFNQSSIGEYYYKVKATDDLGAESTWSNMVNTFVSEVNIDLQNNLFINIFPNPANEYLTINSNDIISDLEISVYDLTGRILINKLISNHSKIDISSLSTGLYILFLKSNNKEVFNTSISVVK